jgi:predicted DNA-binding protein (UPF0251 family)
MQRRGKVIQYRQNMPVQQWQLDRHSQQLQEFIARYQQLSKADRERVDYYFGNIYELLGVEAGAVFQNPDENFFSVLQLLMTNMNDLIPRVGRLENLLENILSGKTPLPQMSLGVQNNNFLHMSQQAQEANEELIRQSSPSIRQSVYTSVSQFKPSGKPSDGRVASGEYDEYIRLCRVAKLPVEDIAIELGISKSGVERRITALKKGGRL